MSEAWTSRVQAEEELERLTQTPAGVKELDRLWFRFCGPGTRLGTLGGTTTTRMKQLVDALFPKD